MRKIFVLLLVLCITSPAQAMMETRSTAVFDMQAFREIPVLHEGRIKPLESFAGAYLLAFSGKSALPDMSATAWLAELLFHPEEAYERPVFTIPNPDVVDALGLNPREGHLYSFNELTEALAKHLDTLKAVDAIDVAQRTPSQHQMVELGARITAYANISESLSLLLDRFIIHDAGLAKELHLPKGKKLGFLDLAPYENKLMEDVKKLGPKKPAQMTKAETEEAFLALDYARISQHRQSALLRIVPPQWASDGQDWLAPWAVLFEGHGSPQSAAYLDLWKKMANRGLAEDQDYARLARDKAYELAGAQISPFRLKLEVLYLQANIFENVLTIYIGAFILLLAFFVSGKRGFYKAATGVLALGALLHFAGIVTRITIMGRPPVATLYETTLFVSFIAVFLSLLFEAKRRDTTGVTAGALIGTVLLFISTRYAAEGDTMEMLVAVLNTNFWLATHVVCVTMGYGCALVAGTLGHLYLIRRWLRPRAEVSHANIANAILAIALIAAFFATLGTILGGIWADQSWGRFWGWDPKENGALLIVLWLLWLLHGRIANILSPLNFASVALLTNVIVALSWFGVNLLGVGLHSYGFTNGIALNLGLFCSIEVLFLAVMRGLIGARKAKA